MSRRHAMTRAFGVISGLFIIPAGLAGAFLIGTASPAPAATASSCKAQLTALATSTASPAPSSSEPELIHDRVGQPVALGDH
jgi:hypothetical protein